MKNIIYIPYLTKKVPVIITNVTDPDYKDMETAVNIECKEAWFNQVRDLTDLWELLELLPDLIAEKKKEKKENIINLRITTEEKIQIEKLAKDNWYKNISSFIRDKVLI